MKPHVVSITALIVLSAAALLMRTGWEVGAPVGPPVVYVSAAAVQTAPRSLVALDGETLGDMSGAVLDVGGKSWAISGDGTTIVSDEDRPTVIVRDARTGIERARFVAPDGTCCPRVSYDGTRLILIRGAGGGPGAVPLQTWYSLEIPTGRVLSTVSTGGGPWEDVVIDADARRLYRLGISPGYVYPGPWPVRIASFDLTTGTQLGEAELPEVAAGRWPTDRTVHYQQLWTDTVWSMQAPGVAVSPDGSSVAIVHADGNAVTVVGADTLTVERTVSLVHAASLLDWIDLLPTVAHAKEAEDGVMQSAIFGPDGRHLYAWGTEMHVDDDGRSAWEFKGLRLIDTQDGSIQAEGLSGQGIDRVAPAADHRRLYVSGWHYIGSMTGATFELVRLDAATLGVLARRDFFGYRALRLRPATPGDW